MEVVRMNDLDLTAASLGVEVSAMEHPVAVTTTVDLAAVPLTPANDSSLVIRLRHPIVVGPVAPAGACPFVSSKTYWTAVHFRRMRGVARTFFAWGTTPEAE